MTVNGTTANLRAEAWGWFSVHSAILRETITQQLGLLTRLHPQA
jgi:hypothetical protein